MTCPTQSHNHSSAVAASATQSERKILYLPVRPLDGLEQFKNTQWIHHASVKRVVVELCGHPRGLRFLREILQQKYSRSKVSPRYDDLMKELSSEFVGVEIVTTSPQLIAACLLGARVFRLNRPDPKIALTYSYYIAQVRAHALIPVCMCCVVCFAFTLTYEALDFAHAI